MKRDRTESIHRRRGGKARAALVGGLMLSVTATAHAQEPARKPDGRGWIFGGGISGGQMGFAGAEGKAVAVGDVVEYVGGGFLGGPLVAQRRIQVMDASAAPPEGTVRVAPFPTGVSAGGINLYGGFAFSPRVSVLADVELMATDGEGFQHIVAGVVVRYWPARRVWIEAGPAKGDVGYSLGAEGTKGDSITGPGVLAAAGLTVLKKPRWTVDLQARYGRVWYDGFQGHNLSFGLNVGRVRSGETRGGGGS